MVWIIVTSTLPGWDVNRMPRSCALTECVEDVRIVPVVLLLRIGWMFPEVADQDYNSKDGNIGSVQPAISMHAHSAYLRKAVQIWQSCWERPNSKGGHVCIPIGYAYTAAHASAMHWIAMSFHIGTPCGRQTNPITLHIPACSAT
jgi:hypothetical protein